MNHDLKSTQDAIAYECDQVRTLLLAKNTSYGNSALDPVRIFSKADPVEQLLVRIDDKLSRIGRGAGFEAADEDTVQDLLGYLILLRVAKHRRDNAKTAAPAAKVATPDVTRI